jgi:hypothetical protein
MWPHHKLSGIFSSTGNAALVRNQSKNGNFTEQQDNEEVCAVIRYLWAQNTTCEHPQTGGACVWCRCGVFATGVEIVLWLCKWWANVDKEGSGRPSASDTIVYDINKMVLAGIRVLVKQAWQWCIDFAGGGLMSWTRTQMADNHHKTQSWVTSTECFGRTDIY